MGGERERVHEYCTWVCVEKKKEQSIWIVFEYTDHVLLHLFAWIFFYAKSLEALSHDINTVILVKSISDRIWIHLALTTPDMKSFMVWGVCFPDTMKCTIYHKCTIYICMKTTALKHAIYSFFSFKVIANVIEVILLCRQVAARAQITTMLIIPEAPANLAWHGLYLKEYVRCFMT